MTDREFFEFETDFIESLRCIPMIVRMKLDICRVKLKLAHWHQFDTSERQSLVTMPCNSDREIQDYREWTQKLAIAKTGTPAKDLTVDSPFLWLDKTKVPEVLIDKAAEFQTAISQQQWSELNNLQRFVLIKLSRPSHENRNFIPALKEFGLINSDN